MTETTRPLQPGELAAIAAALAAAADRLQPGDVPLTWAPAMWAEADRLERLASGMKTLLTGPLEASGVWRAKGYRNVADYMAAISGSTPTASHARVATARRLAHLPSTAAAVRRGALSTTQAEHIADAAKVNPDAEAKLLGLAADGASVGELRDECGRAKAAGDSDPDKTWARLRAQRRLRQYRDMEGAWRLSGCGTADDAATFNAALDEIIDELFAQARDEGREIDRQQLAYDAVILMARRYLATGCADDGSSAPDAARVGGNRAQRRRRKRRRAQQAGFLGLIRVDLEALQRGSVEGEEVCEVAGLGSIPVARARELLGDGVLKLVLTKGAAVGSIVHLGRSPTVAQRTALAWLMPGCSVRGCNRTWTEIDHRWDWAQTHETRLDRLDPLCPFHHAMKTRLGWALIVGSGKRALVPPQDLRHPKHSSASNRPDDASPGPDTSGPPRGRQPVTADQLLDNFIGPGVAV